MNKNSAGKSYNDLPSADRTKIDAAQEGNLKVLDALRAMQRQGKTEENWKALRDALRYHPEITTHSTSGLAEKQRTDTQQSGSDSKRPTTTTPTLQMNPSWFNAHKKTSPADQKAGEIGARKLLDVIRTMKNLRPGSVTPSPATFAAEQNKPGAVPGVIRDPFARPTIHLN